MRFLAKALVLMTASLHGGRLAVFFRRYRRANSIYVLVVEIHSTPKATASSYAKQTESANTVEKRFSIESTICRLPETT